MKILNSLTFITALMVALPSVTFCTNENPQYSYEDLKKTFTEKATLINNTFEKHCGPVKPYIYNPVSIIGACLISSVIGFKKMVIAIAIGGIVVGSMGIIKYLEEAEKAANNEKNKSTSADKT